MANVMLATRTAATSALNSVTVATTTINASLNSLGALAETAEAHARHYRDTSIRELDLTRHEFDIIAETRAKARIARAHIELSKELNADPELLAEFNRISDLWSKPSNSNA